jgi:signal transduction histidine kinase
MRIRDKLLSGFFLMSMVAVAIGGVSYYRLKEVVGPLQTDIPQSIEAMRELDHLDRQVQLMRYDAEVLFNCTQNYVSSQNIWWKERYYAFKAQLDAVLADVVSRNTGESAVIFKQIQAAYDLMANVQQEVIKTVDNKEDIEAEEILKDRSYWENKGRFENLIDTYFSQRGSQYEQAFESSVVLIRITAQKGGLILRNSLALILLWLVVVIIISLLTGMIITDTIAGPIEQLTQFTKGIGQGDFSRQIKIDSKDEVGALSGAFNKMLKDLEEYREKLVRNEKLAAMGKLAGIIGHEIRNPLTGIANSVYFLKMKLGKNADEKILKHLNIMESEVANAETVIEDTLDFAREKEPVLEKTGITGVLEKALGRKIIPENIRLICDIPANLPPVNVDVSQMMRVFYNLIWNAIQAMADGGELNIKVSVDRNDDGGNFIAVAFIDSGPGISTENLKKIFEPLFTTKAKGTGLGLSVCQDIVKAHQGTLEVQSQVAQGTTFTGRLPAAISMKG